jgi:hypothetical protein
MMDLHLASPYNIHHFFQEQVDSSGNSQLQQHWPDILYSMLHRWP